MENPINKYKTVRIYNNLGTSYFLEHASKMAYSIFGMSQFKMSIASFLTEEEKGYWFFRYNKNNGIAPQTEKEARKILEEYKININKRVTQAKENKLLPNDFPQLFPHYLKLSALIPIFVDKKIEQWIAQYIIEIKSVDTTELGEKDFDKQVYTEIGVVQGESVMLQFNSTAILGVDYRHIPIPTLKSVSMFDLLPKEQDKNLSQPQPKVIYKSFPNQKYTLPFVQNTEGTLIPVTHLSVNALKNELIVLNNKKVNTEPLSDGIFEEQLKSKNIKGLYIGGDLEQAKCDILSIVSPICFALPSKTDIIFEVVPDCDAKVMKVTLIIDSNFPVTGIGFQLLQRLTSAKNAYLYQVSDKAKSSISPNGEALDKKGENGIANFSITKRTPTDDDFKKGIVSPSEYLRLLNLSDKNGAVKIKLQTLLYNKSIESPIANDVNWVFDSILTIMKNGEWYRVRSKTMTEIILRPDVVFHELWEAYERTDNIEPYRYPEMYPIFREDQIKGKVWEPAYKIQKSSANKSGKLKKTSDPLEYQYSTTVFGAHERAENAAKNDLQVKPLGPVDFRANSDTKSIPPNFCTALSSKSWSRDRIKKEESAKPHPNDYFLNW
jgi:hypothetical protein